MYPKIKRLLDVMLAAVGLIVLSPVLLAVALMVKLTSPGPVLFRQVRSGRDLKPFTIYKFRTMKMNAPQNMPTHLMKNVENFLTPVGRFLRIFSLDELPQLWNILRGDMSIVGPRPALPTQTDLLAEREKYGANAAVPGLTGWAQINGRDEVEIPVKARLDGEYVEKMSFGFDCKCFFGTFLCVLRHDGVIEGGTGEAKKAKEKQKKGA